ncbi:MAG: hypothetical protein ROR55_02930 [Devosia sp.]
MTEHPNDLGTVWTINGDFAMASIFAILSVGLWPDDPRWFGLKMLSALLALAALLLVIAGLKKIVRAHRRNRIAAEYLAQGGSPKASRMADPDSLRKAGMIR